MSRYFLGPIKNPTWKDFFVRVGGATAVIVAAILVTKLFFPGHEATALVSTALGLVALVAIQQIRHDRNKKAKRRAQEHDA
jgi:hypothetical protein